MLLDNLERIFVVNIPALVKAVSLSTEVSLTVRSALYKSSRLRLLVLVYRYTLVKRRAIYKTFKIIEF